MFNDRKNWIIKSNVIYFQLNKLLLLSYYTLFLLFPLALSFNFVAWDIFISHIYRTYWCNTRKLITDQRSYQHKNLNYNLSKLIPKEKRRKKSNNFHELIWFRCNDWTEQQHICWLYQSYRWRRWWCRNVVKERFTMESKRNKYKEGFHCSIEKKRKKWDWTQEVTCRIHLKNLRECHRTGTFCLSNDWDFGFQEIKRKKKMKRKSKMFNWTVCYLTLNFLLIFIVEEKHFFFFQFWFVFFSNSFFVHCWK